MVKIGFNRGLAMVAWLGKIEREWLRRSLAEERETFGFNESRLRDWVGVELG